MVTRLTIIAEDAESRLESSIEIPITCLLRRSLFSLSPTNRRSSPRTYVADSDLRLGFYFVVSCSDALGNFEIIADWRESHEEYQAQTSDESKRIWFSSSKKEYFSPNRNRGSFSYKSKSSHSHQLGF
jgi:hypothetical protein